MENENEYESKCVFCAAPLRDINEANVPWSGGYPGHYPCSCTVAEKPFMLARFSLAEATARDSALPQFLRDIAHLPEACIVALIGKEFPALVPETYHQSALWAARLPKEFEPRLEDLAIERLGDRTVYSTDLMMARTHLYWEPKGLFLHFAISGFEPRFPWRGKKPCVLFLFVSGETVVLSLHPIEEDFSDFIQARQMRTDCNYRPYREWSDEELAEAALEAAQEAASGGPKSIRTMNDGTIDVYLPGYFPTT
jgi:hypothetical protein